MTALAIRPLAPAEVGLAVDWAAAEGWNPGLNDAATFAAADDGAFLLGSLGTEPVAVISAVRYGATFGFLGFYIVAPAHRGRGHGLSVWQAAMARLRGRTVGLDGVLAQEATYRRSGFAAAFHSVRFRAPAEGGAAASGRPGAWGEGAPVDLAGVPLARVAAYDRPFFPDDRARFLAAWVRQPAAAALGLPGDDGALTGYAVRRPCREGHKIGPLFADTPAHAEALLDAMTAGLGPGEPVFLDVPLANPVAVRLAEGRGMTPVFETVRMYAGGEPRIDLARTYGVTTFELG
jgi:hypothetical protein